MIDRDILMSLLFLHLPPSHQETTDPPGEHNSLPQDVAPRKGKREMMGEWKYMGGGWEETKRKIWREGDKKEGVQFREEEGQGTGGGRH